jgi:hypothetical protein
MASKVKNTIGIGALNPIKKNMSGAKMSQLLIEAQVIMEYWFFFLKTKLIAAPANITSNTIATVCR